MLEETAAAAVEVAIRSGVFGDKASAKAQVDVNGEQMAGSLSELQEEVEVFEGSLQDLVWVMLQVKTRREDGKMELLESRGSPKRWRGCDSAWIGHRKQETHEEHKGAVGLHSGDHRRTVTNIIRKQARQRKPASSSESEPGSRFMERLRNWRRA